MARIRKALIAAAIAAAGTLITSLKAEIPRTQAGWVALFGASLGVGVSAAVGTYLMPNAGTVTGSDPQPVL